MIDNVPRDLPDGSSLVSLRSEFRWSIRPASVTSYCKNFFMKWIERWASDTGLNVGVRCLITNM